MVEVKCKNCAESTIEYTEAIDHYFVIEGGELVPEFEIKNDVVLGEIHCKECDATETVKLIDSPEQLLGLELQNFEVRHA